MKVRSLIAALLANCDENFDAEVFLCPNVQAVDAVESCPGDPMYNLDPYITLHSACKYPAGHGQQALADVPTFCYNHSSYYCGCPAEAAS